MFLTLFCVADAVETLNSSSGLVSRCDPVVFINSVQSFIDVYQSCLSVRYESKAGRTLWRQAVSVL